MSSYLERLGVHPRVQHFFKNHFTNSCETLSFIYGNSFEHASADFHKVPITEELWIAGEPSLAKDIFISSSAMDAIAWLNLNLARYRKLDMLCFIAIGATPAKYHAEFVHQYAPQKKLHFLFSKDDLGAMCDLKMASFIRNRPIKISYQETHYNIHFENRNYEFEHLSLNALEKVSGYNFRIRTHKPKKATSYYEQLRNRYPA